MIRVSALQKTFGKVQAVSDVSLEARDGEITALLGNNGSGKSTTMRAIMGLIRPDAGQIDVDGRSSQEAPQAVKARIGYFPDRFGLYKRLTAREHINYFADLHGLDRTAREKTLARIADALGMGDILERRTEGFSTGQSMKVALARTLIHEPPNLMLDEPTRGLDVRSIRRLRSILRQERDRGCAVLLSSHVMQEVTAMADRVVIIAAGRTVATGTEADIIEKAETDTLEDAFVALSETAEIKAKRPQETEAAV